MLTFSCYTLQSEDVNVFMKPVVSKLCISILVVKITRNRFTMVCQCSQQLSLHGNIGTLKDQVWIMENFHCFKSPFTSTLMHVPTHAHKQGSINYYQSGFLFQGFPYVQQLCGLSVCVGFDLISCLVQLKSLFWRCVRIISSFRM